MLKPIQIYCPDPTERHDYIFDLVFNNLLGVGFSYTVDIDSSHVNYSTENGLSLKVVPNGLLDESLIRLDILSEVKFSHWADTSIFFRTESEIIPFDIFSAIFFLVSRYEEYLNFNPDDHGRFPATESVLFKNGVLEQPLVNQWVKLLKIQLEKNNSLTFSPRKFSYKSTIDIDQAWKYKNKGFVRNTLGFFRDILKFDINELKERYLVLLGKKVDPYYNFDWQDRVHENLNIDVTYFVLLGKYGMFDKNISSENIPFRKLIRKLNEKHQIGIHPSYISNNDESQLNRELFNLNEILKSNTSVSRQHYLMHSVPKTYQNLIKIGINEDHTMGYSTHIGFRAGIATSFLWFDLKNNKKTNLKPVPFCVMDITPMYYRKELPDEAIKTIKSLIKTVKDANGLFVSLWHNESLGESDRWVGWRKVYSAMLEEIKD